MSVVTRIIAIIIWIASVLCFFISSDGVVLLIGGILSGIMVYTISEILHKVECISEDLDPLYKSANDIDKRLSEIENKIDIIMAQETRKK